MSLRGCEGDTLTPRRLEGLDHAMLQVQRIRQKTQRGGKRQRSADERKNAPVAAEIVYRIGKIYEAALEPCLSHAARGCHPAQTKTSVRTSSDGTGPKILFALFPLQLTASSR